MCSLQLEVPKKTGKVNHNAKEDSESLLKKSNNEENLMFELNTEFGILISKLEKEYDLVLKEVDSRNETITKLTSQIGNLFNFIY